MGYDVNYNSVDYADSKLICQHVYQRLQELQGQLLQTAQLAQNCQDQANQQCSAAGLGARGYSTGILADKLRNGYHHATEAVLEARRLEERVSAAIENYVGTESRIEQRMIQGTKVEIWLNFLDQLRLNNFRPPTKNMESMLNLLVLSQQPRFPLAKTQPLRETMHETTQNLTRFLSHFGPSKEETVEIKGESQEESIDVDGSLNSIFELQKVLNDAGPENDGQILIAKTLQDGRDVYLVIIPGTQEDHDGNNPFDTYGIVDAFGNDSNNLVEPITEALEMSGAKDGAEVMLSGYSQGGIHVANLIKNKFLNTKFKLNKILTIGSPIGHIDLPENVRSLSIEDSKDMVPGTDGVPNKRREDQITVIFDGPRIKYEGSEGIFGESHNLDMYGDHIKEIGEDPHPELMENLQEFKIPSGPLSFRRFQLERREPLWRTTTETGSPDQSKLRGAARGSRTSKPVQAG